MLEQGGVEHLLIQKRVSGHGHAAHGARAHEDVLDPRSDLFGGHAKRDGAGHGGTDGRAAHDVDGNAQIPDCPPDAHMGDPEGAAARQNHARGTIRQEPGKPGDVRAVFGQRHVMVQEDWPRHQPMGGAAGTLHPMWVDEHEPPLVFRDQLQREALELRRRRMAVRLRHEDHVIGLAQHGARPRAGLGSGHEKDRPGLAFLRVQPGQCRVALGVGRRAERLAERGLGDEAHTARPGHGPGEIRSEARGQRRARRRHQTERPRLGAAGIGDDARRCLGQPSGQFRRDGLLQPRCGRAEQIVGASVDPQDDRAARRDHVRGAPAARQKGDLADHAARADLGQKDAVALHREVARLDEIHLVGAAALGDQPRATGHGFPLEALQRGALEDLETTRWSPRFGLRSSMPPCPPCIMPRRPD